MYAEAMDAVEEVKARLSIEQVAGEHVDLKRAGSGLKGLCPFHTEKTPSFYVFPARGTFHCFGCGQGGDILTFVQMYDKLDFREALQRLAERAGVELPDERVRQQRAEANTRLYQATEIAAEIFRDALSNPSGNHAREYLAGRRIPQQSQHAFGLGFASDGRLALHDALRKRGLTREEMAGAGLVIMPDDGGSPRDRFHNRLMFPIRDARGRVTGFGGRILGPGEPKYLNSPQTEIFDKSGSLFGIDQAQRPVRESKRIVVVEGYVDTIRAHGAGFTEVVASLGTAITARQLQICSRLAQTVILALDPDPAGKAAAARTALSALAGMPRRQQQLPDSLGRRMVDAGLAVDLRIARIPPDAGDPDELIENHPDTWAKLLDKSVPAFEYYFDTVVEDADRSGEGWRQEIIDRVIPVIREFPFAVGTQVAWVERLAEATGAQARLLQNQLFGSRDRPAPRSLRERDRRRIAGPPAPPRVVDAQIEAENSLLQILLGNPCPPDLAPALNELHPRRSEAAELLARCVEGAGTGRRPALKGLGEDAARLVQDLLSANLDDLPDHRVIPAVRLHIAGIRLRTVQRRLDDLQAMLGDIGPEDQGQALHELHLLLEERADLERQTNKLQHEVVAGVA